MREFAYLIRAFIARDVRIATSYRLQFLFNLVSGFISVTVFYFVSKMVSPDTSQTLAKSYHTDYFSFVLVGAAATNLLGAVVTGYAERLRTGMVEGTLEMMFVSPIRPIWVFVMPGIWCCVFETLRAAVQIAFGAFVYGAKIDLNSGVALFVVLALIHAAFSVFGLMSAAAIMITKRGDPIMWAFAGISGIVAGAYFPVSLLPHWIAWLTKLLPMTYAFDGLRIVLLAGGSVNDVAPSMLVLGICSLAGIPLALFVCRIAVDNAKSQGSLGAF